MPLIDIQKPEVIKFLVERYDKEVRIKQKWNNDFGCSLQLAATIHDEKGYYEEDIKKKEISLGLPSLIKQHAATKRNRIYQAVYEGEGPTTSDLRKKHTIISTGLGCSECDPKFDRPDNDPSPDPIMRPVRPKVQKVLYKNMPTFGRKVYLKSRAKKPPERRYYFAETSGFQYGWRMQDSYFGKHLPAYPRVWKLNKENQSRTGPQPDPPYYNKTQNINPTKYVIL